jgi:hypothetical protein
MNHAILKWNKTRRRFLSRSKKRWIEPESLAELHGLGAREEAIDVGFELGPS